MQSGQWSALASSPSCHTLLQPSATVASQLMPSLFRLWGWFLVGLKPKPFLIVSLLRQHNVDASPLARKKKNAFTSFQLKVLQSVKAVLSTEQQDRWQMPSLSDGWEQDEAAFASSCKKPECWERVVLIFVLLLSLELYFTICCHRMSRTTPLFSSGLAPLVEWQARRPQV